MLYYRYNGQLYGLHFGTYIHGNRQYIVDSRGIVRQDNFKTVNIMSSYGVLGNTEDDYIIHQLEVNTLYRTEGVKVR